MPPTSSTLRSDNLRDFLPRGTIASYVRPLGRTSPRQFVMVIDASQLIHDCLFSPRQDGARTQLEECIDSGLVVAVAPTFAVAEVEKNLPVAAAQMGRVDEAQARWRKSVQPRIRFIDVDEDVQIPTWAHELFEKDPKDLPYIRLLVTTHADVLISRDRHFLNLDGPVRDHRILALLQSYARQEVQYLAIDAGGRITVAVSAGGLITLGESLGKVPWYVWVGGAVIGGAFLTLPIFASQRRAVVEFGKEVWKALPEIVGKFMAEYAARERAADALREKTQQAMPELRANERLTDHAFRVLLSAERPLSTGELAKAVRNAGWRGAERTLPANLGRVLRRDRRVARTEGGGWMVSARCVSPLDLEALPV